jgi:undecaprenyl pyrophosphate phosphatase UppP
MRRSRGSIFELAVTGVRRRRRMRLSFGAAVSMPLTAGALAFMRCEQSMDVVRGKPWVGDW